MNQRNKDNVARTKEDWQSGILNGKNVFNFPRPGKQQMTMNTPKGTVPFPLKYEGYTNGVKTDEGVANPGDDFEVEGDTVKEIPDLNQMSFSKAFNYARENNLPVFTWRDKEYKNNSYGLVKKQVGSYNNPIENQILSNVLLERNKDLDMVKRMEDPYGIAEPINNNDATYYERGKRRGQIKTPSSHSTHSMVWAGGDDNTGYVFPSVVNRTGYSLERMDFGDAADYAFDNRQFIKAPSAKLADYLSHTGYKKWAGWDKKQVGGYTTNTTSKNNDYPTLDSHTKSIIDGGHNYNYDWKTYYVPGSNADYPVGMLRQEGGYAQADNITNPALRKPMFSQDGLASTDVQPVSLPLYKQGQRIKYMCGGQVKSGVVKSHDAKSGKIKLY